MANPSPDEGVRAALEAQALNKLKPIYRPYPARAAESARSALRVAGHRQATIRGAEGFNTPLWQLTIAQFMTPTELVVAEENGALIASRRSIHE